MNTCLNINTPQSVPISFPHKDDLFKKKSLRISVVWKNSFYPHSLRAYYVLDTELGDETQRWDSKVSSLKDLGHISN